MVYEWNPVCSSNTLWHWKYKKLDHSCNSLDCDRYEEFGMNLKTVASIYNAGYTDRTAIIYCTSCSDHQHSVIIISYYKNPFNIQVFWRYVSRIILSLKKSGVFPHEIIIIYAFPFSFKLYLKRSLFHLI